MSHEDLAAAQGLVDLGSYRQALSRCYYAVFYAASALLLTQDIRRHRHSGIQSALGEFFVRPGTLEPEYGKIYARLREDRETGDYALAFHPPRALAVERLREARRFVQRIEQYLIEQDIVKEDEL